MRKGEASSTVSALIQSLCEKGVRHEALFGIWATGDLVRWTRFWALYTRNVDRTIGLRVSRGNGGLAGDTVTHGGESDEHRWTTS
jgi:hypothetical protein